MNTQLDAILTINQVYKSYGLHKALQGVSLHVNRGEFVVLLGPNGAGKSTLFQLLSGLFVADAGDIVIEQHDIRYKATKALAGLGIVFQQQTLDLNMTVQANLRFHARLHGMGRRADERIQAELARLGLIDQLTTPCARLSGGNRRKVELARALLHEPGLLLMDEATVGLDPASRRSLVAYVVELCRTRGLGVLWATHLVDEAEQADRIIVLNKGTVKHDGAAADLIAQTAQPSLAEAFIHLTGQRKTES